MLKTTSAPSKKWRVILWLPCFISGINMAIVAIISFLAAIVGLVMGAPAELIEALLAIGGVLAVLQLVIIGVNRLALFDPGPQPYVYARRRPEDRRER